MEHWQLQSSKMSAVINPVGAMFGQWMIELGGETFSPLARAPWHDDPNSQTLPPILRNLQGEWPCIPFGIVKPSSSFTSKKQVQIDTKIDQYIDNCFPHGKSSNQEWQLVKKTDEHITLIHQFSAHDAVFKATRDVWLDDTSNSVKFKLSLESNKNVRIPIGLHPTFALSEQPQMSELVVGSFRVGMTYPIDFESSSQFVSDRSFEHLQSIPLVNGDIGSAIYLPFTEPREELIQLLDVDGEISLLRHDLGMKSTLKWDTSKLPHCCIWLSCKGRDYYPWNSRHLAIGIEPTHSYFDLNPSRADEKHGLVCLQKDVPFNIEYSISTEKVKE
ncbi:hypothetical protein [Vibrio minamisatsumaniensis]|uniref:hypothetical protein n=1 Tax=Vibrio minamisatsumaniensis TaxID=2910243 RepID=UPI003D204DF2